MIWFSLIRNSHSFESYSIKFYFYLFYFFLSLSLTYFYSNYCISLHSSVLLSLLSASSRPYSPILNQVSKINGLFSRIQELLGAFSFSILTFLGTMDKVLKLGTPDCSLAYDRRVNRASRDV